MDDSDVFQECPATRQLRNVVFDDLRELLGLKPLPNEPPHRGLMVTLDGVTYKTAREWAVELGMTRQAIDHRLKAIEHRKSLGVENPYRRVTKYQKRKRAERYMRQGLR